MAVASVRIGNEILTSRRQVELLIENFDPSGTVILDFADVSRVGVDFADELFRVFFSTHPEMDLRVINASESVLELMRWACGSGKQPSIDP